MVIYSNNNHPRVGIDVNSLFKERMNEVVVIYLLDDDNEKDVLVEKSSAKIQMKNLKSPPSTISIRLF